MTLNSFSDMGQLFMTRRDSNALKTDLARLTSELASGKKEDIGAALRGDFSTLADISRSLRLNATFRTSVTEASIAAAGRQASLERIQNEVEGFAAPLLALSGAGTEADLQIRLADAGGRFETAVDALNTRLAGRSLFAADQPDNSALIDGQAILDELRPLVAGSADAATMIATVSAWFNDAGGGYESLAWQGGAGAAPAVLIGEGQTADPSVTALDPTLRETLTNLALTALVSEQAGGLSDSERGNVIVSAAEGLITAEGNLIALRAQVGAQEQRIEEALVAAETAKTMYEIEYNRIVQADPYDTATELEAASTRLESLYIVTSRLSRLSLTEFIR